MIGVREEEGVTILELAHGKANAMDLELCRHLIHVLDTIRDSCRAVVITAGGRIFSAGVDLLRLLDGGEEYAHAFVPALIDAFRVLFEFPRPVIAAVNGHAVAGGCVLACAADYRVLAGEGAKIGIPELRVGVPFPAAAIEIMREVLTPSRFRSLVLGGATLDPAAAEEWGLVDRVVPATELMGAALTAARDLMSIPPDVFRVTKLQMRLPAIMRIAAADQKYGGDVLRIWGMEETRASVQSYVQKTLRR